MPIKNGRVCVEVTCNCGAKTTVSSGDYGTYCITCGKPIFAAAYKEALNDEIRKVVKEERSRIRKSKKDHTFKGEDFSTGSSPLLSQCANCGGPISPESVFIVDGEVVCKNCYENTLPKCKGCGERHFSKYLKKGLCEGCQVSYVTCGTCGNVYDKRVYKPINLNGKEYCDKCISNYLSGKNIHFRDHSFKPSACFFGEKEDGRYYGCEVEMDNSYRRKEFMALAHCEEVYFKSDGSLGSDGVEVVSHPATLAYHTNELPWGKIFAAAKKTGFRSHTGSSEGFSATPTCGLHIHTGKSSFGRTSDDRDRREAKMLVLFDKFWPQLVTFSRRDAKALSSWARRYSSFDVTKDQLNEIIHKAKGENGHGKHLAVNFNGNGGETIEFRLFRGTTNKETLIASIQLLDAMIECTKLSTKKVQELTWEEFCEKTCEKYPEFRGYISRLRDMKRNI